MIEREFAGEPRSFALGYPRNWPTVAVGCFEGERFGNLALLVQLAINHLLGSGAVHHVLAHALAGPDNPAGLLKAQALVREEMAGKPLDMFLGLAVEVIREAYASKGENG